MRGILAQDYAGYTVLIGGDLNDDPLSDTLNSFYHADYGEDAHGQLKEVDSPCGNGMYVYADILVGAYCRDGERTGGELPLPGAPVAASGIKSTICS